LKFPDSSLRGYDDCAELCTGADPVLPRVRNALERIILKFKPSVVFCPIGVGNHIDHNLTRQAIMCCVPRKSLVLCEDLPYAATYSLESVSLLAKQQNFDEILVDISNSVEGKKNAVRIYASQISKLEEDFIMGQSTRFRAGRNFERIFISKGGNKSRGVFTLDHLEISKY
jgi:LmbE family N-acetylglucosaminyl deacetylase